MMAMPFVRFLGGFYEIKAKEIHPKAFLSFLFKLTGNLTCMWKRVTAFLKCRTKYAQINKSSSNLC